MVLSLLKSTRFVQAQAYGSVDGCRTDERDKREAGEGFHGGFRQMLLCKKPRNYVKSG